MSAQRLEQNGRYSVATCLLQTGHLAAMGLAPCANGSGNSRPLQEVLDGDPFEEVAIGEFCLGVPPTGS